MPRQRHVNRREPDFRFDNRLKISDWDCLRKATRMAARTSKWKSGIYWLLENSTSHDDCFIVRPLAPRRMMCNDFRHKACESFSTAAGGEDQLFEQ